MKLQQIVWVAGALLSGCGPQSASYQVTIYGEDFIEQEIPAAAMADGWRVKFDRFLISVGQVRAASGHEPPEVSHTDWQVVDLAKPSGGAGFLLFEQQVPEGRYDHVEYRIAPPEAGNARAANVDAADLQLLFDRRASLYVEGTAEKGAVSKRFRWAFDTNTLYTHCESTAEVKAGQTGTSQITIHADHLLYDDLFSPEPNVAFQLLADSDADNDGEVTEAELGAKDIRTQANYQVGSTGITDLWSFIRHQTGTVGHIDGEGHCEVGG